MQNVLETILVCARTLPLDAATASIIAPLADALSARPTGAAAFVEFWSETFATVPIPEGGWPQACLKLLPGYVSDEEDVEMDDAEPGAHLADTAFDIDEEAEVEREVIDVDALDDETVSYEANIGLNGLVPETFRVSIRVTKERYATAVAWLRDLIYGAEFDRERLAISVAQIQSGLPSLKRDGNTVLSSVLAGLLFSKSYTSSAVSVLPQSEFIPDITARLKEKPDEVIQEFEQIRKVITDPSGVRFSVAGNILDLPNPRSVWAEHFSKTLPASPLAPIPFSHSTLSKVGRKPVKKAIVVSLPTIESAFVSYTSTGIRGWQHEDYPALRVAIEVLGATESFLWRYIRGSGLAYGAYAGVDLEAGHVTFSLYRSSNALAAAAQGKVVVNGLVDGSIALEETALDAAKSSIVFAITRGVSTPGRAVRLLHPPNILDRS